MKAQAIAAGRDGSSRRLLEASSNYGGPPIVLEPSRVR